MIALLALEHDRVARRDVLPLHPAGELRQGLARELGEQADAVQLGDGGWVEAAARLVGIDALLLLGCRSGLLVLFLGRSRALSLHAVPELSRWRFCPVCSAEIRVEGGTRARSARTAAFAPGRARSRPPARSCRPRGPSPARHGGPVSRPPRLLGSARRLPGRGGASARRAPRGSCARRPGSRSSRSDFLGIWMDRYGEAEDAHATLNLYWSARARRRRARRRPTTSPSSRWFSTRRAAAAGGARVPHRGRPSGLAAAALVALSARARTPAASPARRARRRSAARSRPRCESITICSQARSSHVPGSIPCARYRCSRPSSTRSRSPSEKRSSW